MEKQVVALLKGVISMGGIVRRIILFSFAISKAEDHRHRLGRVVAKLGEVPTPFTEEVEAL
jgi:hypothetical protein